MRMALNTLLNQWIHPPYLSRDDGIRYYQERLLNTLLLALVFPGLLVYAVSIALSIRDDLWLVVVTDTAVYAYAVFLFFRKSLSYRLRAVSMVLISYLLGIVLLLATGVFAAGPVWLFAFPVMAALLLGTVPALSALVVNGLTLVFLGLLIGAGKLTTDAHTLHGVWEWTVLGLNFMLLNSIVALSISVASNELQELFAQKDDMLASLAQRKAALEASSRQLTEQMLQREAADAERGRLQEQLRQSQKMESIGTLAGGIAHDFNNILSSVIGYTELALNDVEPSSPPRQYLQEVMHASQRATALVRQILMFSRQGEQTLKPVQLKGVVKEAMQLLRASLPTTIEIRESYEQDPGVVLADQTQIHQVVMNLCTNAKHAMEGRNGRIEVSLARVRIRPVDPDPPAGLKPGEYVQLIVADNGEGIPDAIRHRLYDPYFTTKAKEKGTGLGLSVVQGIVQNHGGAIALDSVVGRGTTFKVYLPMAPPRADDIAVRTWQPVVGGSERILVVDDEAPIAQMLQRSLQGLGYQVEIRTSSAEALAALQAGKGLFDLVITDMTMPYMTGDRLAREIKALYPGFPIILCTGFSETITRETAAAIGIDAFLLKPVDRASLAQTIRKVMDERS